MKIVNGKIITTEKREISMRDYFKQLALDYINALNEIERIKKEFEARIKSHNEVKKNCLATISSLKIIPDILKELQKDRNAYTIMNKAFPKVFTKLKGDK